MSVIDHTVGFFGECMIELKGNPATGIRQGYAGDTLNTALYFNRLVRNKGIDTHYITALGTDAFSDHMVAFWQSEHIKTDFVLRDPSRLPGIYAIAVDENGERQFSYWREQSAAKFYFEGILDSPTFRALSRLQALYLSGISLAILPTAGRARLLELLRAIKANGGAIYFDNNFRPKLWQDYNSAKTLYSQVLALADIALLTLDDEHALFGASTAEAVLTRLAPLAIPEIVIKQGAGPCVVKAAKRVHKVDAVAVAKPVDTTAAGDSFGAAYLACRLLGGSVEAAASAGHRLAAAVIQHEGAILPEQKMRGFGLL
ncbi:MAG TPA: sugar kinase [Marinagarivorans sp.]